MDDDTKRHLRRFVRESICSEAQKKALKKAKLIAYSHGLWHLTDDGVKAAKEEGFLD